MKQFLFVALAALTTLALGLAQAEARVLDHVKLNVGVSGVLPDESAKISVIGGTVDVSDEYVPSLGVEYFFTDHVSAELFCCAARHDVAAVNTALGRVDLGQITHFPPTLTVKYRWTNLGRFQPYVGVGVNYTHFFDKSLPSAGPVTGIKYTDSVGPALQAGLDYKLDKHWSVFADARKIWMQTDVKIQAGPTRIKADADLDPVVATVGVGYHF